MNKEFSKNLQKNYNYSILAFDFDGVLADSKLIIFNALNHSLEKLNLDKVSIVDYERFSKNELLEQRNLSFIKKLVLLYFARNYISKHCTKIKLFHEFIAEIKKYPFDKVIISSNSKSNIEKILKKDVDLFKKIHGSCGISGKAKILKKYKEGLYITDEVRDINECKIANIDVAAVSWGIDNKEELMKAKPTYLLDNFNQLAEII